MIILLKEAKTLAAVKSLESPAFAGLLSLLFFTDCAENELSSSTVNVDGKDYGVFTVTQHDPLTGKVQSVYDRVNIHGQYNDCIGKPCATVVREVLREEREQNVTVDYGPSVLPQVVTTGGPVGGN